MATYMKNFHQKLLQSSRSFYHFRSVLQTRNPARSSRLILRHSSINSNSSNGGSLRRTLTLLAGVSTTSLFCVWYGRQQFLRLKSVAFCHGEGACMTKHDPTKYDQFAEDTPRQLIKEDAERLTLTLYQYQTCPFCCKVRSFLEYYGFPYKIVEVDPIRRTQIKWSEYSKVPIVVCHTSDGKEVQLNDSSLTISALTTFMVTDKKDITEIVNYYPVIEGEGKTRRGKKSIDYANKLEIMLGRPGRTMREKEEKKWRGWVDNKLVHYLAPNIYRTPSEAIQAFDYISTQAGFSGWEQFAIKYLGATAMYFISRRLKKKYELPSDVRSALYGAAHEWVKAVGNRPYLGGEEPCIADLNVYGVLSSIEGLNAFNDMLRETKIGPWYYRTQAAVKSQAGAAHLKDDK